MQPTTNVRVDEDEAASTSNNEQRGLQHEVPRGVPATAAAATGYDYASAADANANSNILP
jgi:hypothetical protein